MLVHPWDTGSDDDGWAYLCSVGFAQLIAAGAGRSVPVVVPTQFLVTPEREVLLHLAAPNPIWAAIAENPTVLLTAAGDWSYIPGGWKGGIPTTYYTAVQLEATATVLGAAEDVLPILRAQLADAGDTELPDPAVHARRLPGIRGLRLTPVRITTKLKYGGNSTPEVRADVATRLAARGGPGDAAAIAHLTTVAESNVSGLTLDSATGG